MNSASRRSVMVSFFCIYQGKEFDCALRGIRIFFREAENGKNPASLLLHGFPALSLMFKNLMVALSDKFYLVAPDYPGFGFSDFPDTKDFEYSFKIYRHTSQVR